MVDKAQDEVRAVLRIARRVPLQRLDTFSIDGGADDRAVPQRDGDSSDRDGDSELDRAAGRRHRRDEHHAGGGGSGRGRSARKAIGAAGDIVVQFRRGGGAHGTGGILGLALGWSISRGGIDFPQSPTAVPLWAAMAGVMVSVGVGSSGSGRRASGATGPVEALVRIARPALVLHGQQDAGRRGYAADRRHRPVPSAARQSGSPPDSPRILARAPRESAVEHC